MQLTQLPHINELECDIPLSEPLRDFVPHFQWQRDLDGTVVKGELRLHEHLIGHQEQPAVSQFMEFY